MSDKCPDCNGVGGILEEPGLLSYVCDSCKGSGVVTGPGVVTFSGVLKKGGPEPDANGNIWPEEVVSKAVEEFLAGKQERWRHHNGIIKSDVQTSAGPDNSMIIHVAMSIDEDELTKFAYGFFDDLLMDGLLVRVSRDEFRAIINRHYVNLLDEIRGRVGVEE